MATIFPTARDAAVDHVQRWLNDRADSYSREATILRRNKASQAARVYETIRDELRRCAKDVGK